MTATNVAEEVNREAGRVRNQSVRPPPIDVDTTLAMDDVPEDDKALRWYSITIGMPGAQMLAMCSTSSVRGRRARQPVRCA